MKRRWLIAIVSLSAWIVAPGLAQQLTHTGNPDLGTHSIGPIAVPLSASGGGGSGYVWEVVNDLGQLPAGLALRTDTPFVLKIETVFAVI